MVTAKQKIWLHLLYLLPYYEIWIKKVLFVVFEFLAIVDPADIFAGSFHHSMGCRGVPLHGGPQAGVDLSLSGCHHAQFEGTAGVHQGDFFVLSIEGFHIILCLLVVV